MKYFRLFYLVVLMLCITSILVSAQITYNWNGGNGNWNTSSKWTPSGVPGVGDTAIVSNGSINLNSNNEITAFFLHGGELQGNGALTVSSFMEWTGGNMSGGGTTEIIQSALLEISSQNLKELDRRTLSNAGTMVWTDAGSIGLGNDAIVIIQDSGIFDIQTDATIENLDQSNSMIVNNGLITKSSGTGVVNFDISCENKNRFNIETGTIRLNNSGTDQGIYDINAASTLDFAGGNRILRSSALLTGTGNVSFTGDSLVNNANINPGTSPGIININGNLPLNDSANVNIEIGGNIAGNDYDRITVTDTVQFNGTLNVTLINGFTPFVGDTFKIITYTEQMGQFNTVTGNNLGNGMILEQTYTSNGLVLVTNSQPFAIDDSVATDEDFEISFNVLANDYDPGNDSLSIFSFTQPSNGTVTQSSDSLFTYLPSLNYNGLDSFTYIINDNNARLDTATVVINIVSVNDSPTITSIPDTVSVQDQLYTYQVTATDPDSGDLLSYFLNTAPNFLNIDTTSGFISGIPAYSDTGDHIVSVRVVDSFYAADTQSYSLTVSDVNDPPVISPLPELSFAEDDTLNYHISNWFNFVEDLDDPDSTLNYSVVSGSNVNAIPGNDVYYFYSPQNWFGQDTLHLIVSDGFLSDTSDLYISVSSVNDTPVVLLPDSVIFSQDTSASLLLWDYINDVESPDSLLNMQFSASNDSLLYNYDSTSGIISFSAQTGFWGTVSFSVIATDDGGAYDQDTLIVRVSGVISNIDDILSDQIPKTYSISQNYPNPFNPNTKIKFALPKSEITKIDIFNLLGQKIITLLDKPMSAGTHEIEFKAQFLPSGVYLYRIEAGTFQQVRKMTLLK